MKQGKRWYNNRFVDRLWMLLLWPVGFGFYTLWESGTTSKTHSSEDQVVLVKADSVDEDHRKVEIGKKINGCSSGSFHK